MNFTDAEQRKATHITPPGRFIELDVRELWRYRDLLRAITRRDLTIQYRQMALGPLWAVLNPLIDMLIFTFVFSTIADLPSENIPYYLFVFAGLVPWSYFSVVTQDLAGVLVNESYLISRVYFPRIILGIARLLSNGVYFLISLVLLIILAAIGGYLPNWRLLALPFFVLFGVGTALGWGLLLAALVARFRDMRNIARYGLQILKFLTPVAYSATLVDARWLPLYQLNPAYWMIEGFRWSVLGTQLTWNLSAVIALVVAVLSLLVGYVVFKRAEYQVVDWV